MLAYASTVLGTFLNRSGIVQSVHAFAGGPVGPVFLGFLALLLIGGMALTAWRTPRLRDWGEPPALVSREGAFLAGNWLFLVFTVVVLLGTLFPVIVEAVTGRKNSIGAPFYTTFAVPLGLGLLLLMGVGPLLPWRRADGESLLRALRLPGGAGLVAGAAAFLLGVRSAAVLLTVALCAYNVAGLASLVVRAAGPRGLAQALREQPRRYGAYTAHLGLVVLALGLAFSGTYKRSAETTLNLAQPKTLLGQTLQLDGLSQRTYPYGSSAVAQVRIGGVVSSPRMNIYAQDPGTTFPTPAVRYSVLGDTYLVVTAFDEQKGQWASVRLIESPLVSWIWVGTLIIVLGAGVTLVPPRRPAVRRVSGGAVAAD